jgi:hypothetical protein
MLDVGLRDTTLPELPLQSSQKANQPDDDVTPRPLSKQSKSPRPTSKYDKSPRPTSKPPKTPQQSSGSSKTPRPTSKTPRPLSIHST